MLKHTHTQRLFIRSWYGRYHQWRYGRAGRGGVTRSAQTVAAEPRLMPSIVCARVSPQSRKPARSPVVVATEFLFFSESFFLPLGNVSERQTDRRADGSCIIIKFRVRSRPRAPHPHDDQTTQKCIYLLYSSKYIATVIIVHNKIQYYYYYYYCKYVHTVQFGECLAIYRPPTEACLKFNL